MPTPGHVDRARRVGVVAMLMPILLVWTLTACTGDTGNSRDTAGRNTDDGQKASAACALVSADSASLAMGQQPGKTFDESVDQGGPASNWVSCRYTPAAEGPVLWVRAQQTSVSLSPPKTTGSRRCEPLGVDGVEGHVCTGYTNGPVLAKAIATWDDRHVNVELTASSERPGDEQMANGLRAVVRDLHANITPAVFELT